MSSSMTNGDVSATEGLVEEVSLNAVSSRNDAPESTTPIYHLSDPSTYIPRQPLISSDLSKLYGVEDIQATVARFNPVTGEKHKIRKSYKGYLADLAGKNEMPAMPDRRPVREGHSIEIIGKGVSEGGTGLLWAVDMPQTIWEQRWGRPAEGIIGMRLDGTALNEPQAEEPMYGLGEVFDPDAVRYGMAYRGPTHDASLANKTRRFDAAKLMNGLRGMKSGDVPGFDASVLGLGDTKAGKRVNGTTQQPLGPPLLPNALRASRGKRRRYDDSAFEGYGEEEDDNDPTDNYGYDGTNDEGYVASGPGGKRTKKRKTIDSNEYNSNHYQSEQGGAGGGGGAGSSTYPR